MEQKIFEQLFAAAKAARENSYSPISNFKVGAAIRTKTGNIYAGTNAEDAAFNHTIHAEQACIAQMVSKEGRQEITELVTVAGGNDGTICTPCGHCRQLLLEFAPDSLEIYSTAPDGNIQLKTTLGELLPYPFRLANFK
jgi:cytidine deaminase